MPPVGFEPTISSGERPKTYALDRAATGTGFNKLYGKNFRFLVVDLMVGTVATRQGVNSLYEHDVKIWHWKDFRLKQQNIYDDTQERICAVCKATVRILTYI